MHPYAITQQYYARWLGVEADVLAAHGVRWQYNPERNGQPAGYPAPIDVYAYISKKTIVIAYGDRAKSRVPEIRGRIALGMAAETIGGILETVFASPARRHLKFLLQNPAPDVRKTARRLTCDDYPLFLDFFRAVNPNCQDVSWVRDYFTGIAGKGYCHGVIADERLVSATDAPDVPFMSDHAQEIGINTLPGYQRMGFAQDACLSCIHDMLGRGICPLWSTSAANVASQRLAARIGFVPYFDNLALSL